MKITINEHNLKEALKLAELEIYTIAYKQAKNNQSKAARLLGISRVTFRTKMGALL